MKRSPLKKPDFIQRSASCLVALLLSVAMATAADKTAGEHVLAEVNDVPIRNTAVQESVRAYLLRIGHKELSASRMAALENDILQTLIEEELLYQEGQKQGLVVDEAEIEAGVLRIRNRFSSDRDFEAALAKAVLDRETLRKGVARSLLIKRIWEDLSEMTEADRKQRLQTLTEKATILITPTDSGEGFFNRH